MKTVPLSVSVFPEQKRRFEANAKLSERSISFMVREALTLWLEQFDQTKAAKEKRK